jgi:hypothetical protein
MAKKKTAPPEPRSLVAATTSEEVQLAVASDLSTPAPRSPTRDEIEAAAYRRYLNRGGSDGQDFDDWLEAERELRGKR